jgi:glycine cleavage system H protein
MCALPATNESHFSIVPEGEKRCVWMELGMVAYKICDRDFQCETCPLDIGLRGDSDTADSTSLSAFSRAEEVHPLRSALLSRMVQPLRWTNRFFHPRHFWLQMLNQNHCRVGFDLLAASLIGSIEQIDLPKIGERVEQDKICGSFVKQGREYIILSPITGEIKAVNETLSSWPNRLQLEPMEEGWLFEVQPESLRAELSGLRRGRKLWSWYVNEILKLDNKLALLLNGNTMTQIDEDSLADELLNTISGDAYSALLEEVIGRADQD